MVDSGSSKIAAGDYIITNADQNCAGRYLSFAASLSGSNLVLNGGRAVQWKVKYPPHADGTEFVLECVWMGNKGTGHSSHGKMVQLGSFSQLRLHTSKGVLFRAHRVPNVKDHYFLELVDAKKTKTKFLGAVGLKVQSSSEVKSQWKFLGISPTSCN